MNESGLQRVLALAIVMTLLVTGTWPAAASGMPSGEAKGHLIRLKYATFDPLSGLPETPRGQRIDAYPDDGSGPYIVQFVGPIEEGWKEQVSALGGRVLDYLPDYAFLVWMDAAVRAQVESLASVRWTGIYQPAYKISPSYDGTPMVRVLLFKGADLAAVEEHLARIDLGAVRVDAEVLTAFAPDGDVTQLAALPEVAWIEKRPIYELHNDVATEIMGGGVAWAAGLDGSGMIVAAADTGVDTGIDSGTPGDMHPDLDNRLAEIHSWPVMSDDGCGGCCIANLGADDGASDVSSGHGTHVIGSVAGNGAASGGQIRGLAYEATLTFQAVEQYVDFTPYCEGLGFSDGYYLFGLPDDITTLFQQAYDWGARIHSNSWGSPVGGEYTADAQSVDEFVWSHPDMTILYSAGNWGRDANGNGFVDEDSIGSPGTAKNAITTGASDNERDTGGLNPGGPCYTWYGCWGSDFPANPTRDDRISDTRQELAAFSSRGPTGDGRIKPDLVAPGTNVVSTRSSLAASDGWGTYPNPSYVYMGGTSMATPLLAGAAALVREYYVEQRGHNPSAALVKATLINSAVDLHGYGDPAQEAGLPVPNNHEGWGAADVGAATGDQHEFRDGDQVGTGGSVAYSAQVDEGTTALKISLVWSDYPANPSAGGLVNNLNLVVEAPGGETYRGNNFAGGWSIPGGTADTANNVESVFVENPAAGTWALRVEGANVPQAPQPFAVVWHSDTLLPSIELAKTVGTEPGSCATTDAITITPGTPVYYCYEITNTGTYTLPLHDLVDSELGTLFSGLAYDLAPGASLDTVAAGLTISTTITRTTVNTATWTAYVDGGPPAVATDTATVTLAPASIELTKTVGAEPGVCATTDLITVTLGTPVYYCYEITNTGTYTLPLHDLVDSDLGTLFSGLPYDLEPGASVDTVSAGLTISATITRTTVNTATWTAFYPSAGAVASAGDNATVIAVARPGYRLYLPIMVRNHD